METVTTGRISSSRFWTLVLYTRSPQRLLDSQDGLVTPRTKVHYAKGEQDVRYFYYDSLRAECSIYDPTIWFA
jgi:hypothetical protein